MTIFRKPLKKFAYWLLSFILGMGAFLFVVYKLVSWYFTAGTIALP